MSVTYHRGVNSMSLGDVQITFCGSIERGSGAIITLALPPRPPFIVTVFLN